MSKLLVYHWKHDFAKQVTSSVASKLCTVSPMKYSEIMELDRKVREHPGFSSEYLNNLDAGGSPEIFQVLAVTLYREISAFYRSQMLCKDDIGALVYRFDIHSPQLLRQGTSRES